LVGDSCQLATHVITDLSIGALGYVVMSQGRVEGEAAVWGQETGGGHSRSTGNRFADGNKASCDRRNLDDALPPDGCRAVIGVGLKRIRRGNQEAVRDARVAEAANRAREAEARAREAEARAQRAEEVAEDERRRRAGGSASQGQQQSQPTWQQASGGDENQHPPAPQKTASGVSRAAESSSGFYVRVELGLGAVIANAKTTPCYQSDTSSESRSATGGGPSARLSLGTSVFEGLMIGVAGSGYGSFFFGSEELKSDMASGWVGPFLHYYPSWIRNFGAGIEGGYTYARWKNCYRCNDNDSRTDLDGGGFYLSGVLGWDWGSGDGGNSFWGFGGRITYSQWKDSSDSTQTFNALFPSFVVHYTYF